MSGSFKCNTDESMFTIVMTSSHDKIPPRFARQYPGKVDHNRLLSSKIKSEHTIEHSCVRFANKPVKVSGWTGHVCETNITQRYMYNEDGIFGCSQCCTEHHWSGLDDQCMPCGPHSTQPEPNVWKDCYPRSDHVISSNDDKGMIPYTTQAKTTTETTPGIVTTTQRKPDNFLTTDLKRIVIKVPVKAPKHIVVRNVTATFAWVSWRKIRSTEEVPIEKYKVKVQNIKSKKIHYYKVIDADIKLRNLKPDSQYKIEIAAENFKGVGPWSKVQKYSTLQLPPHMNVKSISNVGSRVKVVWKPKADDDRFSVVVEYWPDAQGNKLTKVTDFIKTVNDKEATIFFNLTTEGQYYVRAYYYDENAGSGPPSRRFIKYERNGRENVPSKLAEPHAIWIPIVVAIFILFTAGTILYVCKDD
uniref:uncharacterized protein LOC120339731 n=1 Tax=Styela clava TaxID=7725 RepID=UPI00193983A8|nr:uncharacterized protein LOC120339731 [Styela clava]